MDTLNFIPAWVVGASLMLTGFMWLITRDTKIRLDSRIWGNTYVWISLLYFASYLADPADLPTFEERIMRVRFLICILCLSQWFPLAVSYMRQLHNRKVINGLVGEINSNNSSS